jgi:hypothetical protein
MAISITSLRRAGDDRADTSEKDFIVDRYQLLEGARRRRECHSADLWQR